MRPLLGGELELPGVRPALLTILFVSRVFRTKKSQTIIWKISMLRTGCEPLHVDVPEGHPIKGRAAMQRGAHEERGRGW